MNNQEVKELLNIEETSVEGNNPHPFLSWEFLHELGTHLNLKIPLVGSPNFQK